MPETESSASPAYLAKCIGVVIIIVIVGWFIYNRYTSQDPAINVAIKLMNQGDTAYRESRLDDALELFDQAGILAHRTRMDIISAPTTPPNRPRADASRKEMEGQLNSLEADALYRWADCRLLQVQREMHEVREKAVAAGETFYLNSKMLAEPERRLIDSIDLYPARSGAYFLLGFIYREKSPDSLDQAIAAFQKAILHDQRSPDANNALGEAYYIKGEIEKAREHFEKAILLNNDYAGAHLNLGMYYVNKQDLTTMQADAENAKKCMARFVELTEENQTFSKADLALAQKILKSLADSAASTP